MYRKIKRTQSDIHTCGGVFIKIYNSYYLLIQLQSICVDADRDHDDRDLEIVT